MQVCKANFQNNNKNQQSFGAINYPLSGPFAKEIKAVVPRLKEEAKDVWVKIQFKDNRSEPFIVATATTPNTLKSRFKKINDVFEIAVSDDIDMNMSKESKEQLVFDTAKKVIDQYKKAITIGPYKPHRGEDAVSMMWYGLVDFIKKISNKGKD